MPISIIKAANKESGSCSPSMAANKGYLSVLAKVARCIEDAVRDHRIPDLTPEQVVRWLHSVTVEDLKIAMGLQTKPEPSRKQMCDEASAAGEHPGQLPNVC
jgi:hypothetical protein